MSEVQSRPARGRSSARGGRGGFGSRGSRKTNGDGASSNIDTTAEQGELGELKKQYQSQLSTLKELFPDWTDADLVLALDESGGDLETTIEKISEGAVSQFAEVPKKAKDRSRSKAAKDTPVVSDATSGARAGRGDGPRRGGDSVRGGRGRGTDRGRGGLRGGRGGASTGPRPATGSVPTTESPAWGAPAASEESKDVPKENGQSTETSHPHIPDVIEKPVVKVAEAAKKTWASMFAKPAPPPAVPKPAAKPAANQSTPAPNETPAHESTHDSTAHAEEVPQPPIADQTIQEPSIATEDTSKITPDKIDQGATPELTLTPSKDKLTEENVEHLPDESHPPPTETAFSTVASSKDIGSAVATPLSGPAQAPIGRPAVGGYATTALKATSATPQRSASFQKRLKEQQEAVVMPGNHAVDRAAVQFGSLGLGDGADLDVDEDREEAETRTQPPQHSPVAQPRAALPPVHRQQAPQEAQQQESLPTPKQAPGLPPVPQQQNIPQQSPSNPLAAQAMQNQGSNQSYNQFGRYGQGSQNEPSAPPQKAYDPFGQQIPQSNQYDYPGQQSQAPSQPGAFSSAPDSFASQYLTSEQRSQQYQNYYGGYGQQHGQSQQDAGSAQQRTGSGFGSGPDSTFGQTQQQGQTQSRYNDAQNSGHNTPNPAASAQQGPGSQSQHLHGQQQQQGHAGGYPYNHPYYGSPYYANYMNQFGGYGQGQGYGSFGKGMYGQPHHYGMSPQAAFEQHSSSPANAGGFGASSLHERGSGFGEYGRSASAASQNPTATAGSSGFGSIPESFSRPQGYSNQSSYGQQQAGQQGLGEESLKAFGDSKTGGPSPAALGAQPGRPGSATQSTPSQSGQGNLPQHSQQQGFGGYPGHLGGNNQYGGLGGLGHQNSAGHQQQQQQQQQQQSGYGNYGGFSGYGGGSYNRGGWGGNYGQH